MKRFVLALSLLAACGDNKPEVPDSNGVTTDHCEYVDMVPTAGSGGTVTKGALTAGAAEEILDVPVGTALGGYTARAQFLGGADTIDTRKVPIAGTFNPSVGIASSPRVKAVALTAGGETVVMIKVDMIFTYEGMLFDVEKELGPEFAGKVILSSSHSHSAWAQYSGHAPLKLGSGELRDIVYQRFVSAIVKAARGALAARSSAKLGIFTDDNFDPNDTITRDRRGDNDKLPGGKGKDKHLTLIRVDRTDGKPIAAIPVFGIHGTLLGESNPLASTESIGAVERALENVLPQGAVVMHLQSAGGDVSPVGHGSVDCNRKPGRMKDPCLSLTSEEGLTRAAAATMLAAYNAAASNMRGELEMEMISRSIELGPKASTFTVRDGALRYAQFDTQRVPDGNVFNPDGSLISPIDEFNAPVGAALCETDAPMFPSAAIEGTEGTEPYGSCLRLDVAGEILESIFRIDFGVEATKPVCETTRTTISALRIDDYLFGTLPGEVTVLIADLVRAKSPAPGKTIVLGYAQGHVGYLLRPEDWVLGGYEPSVTFWGPLEAEYIAERLLDLLPLAQTPAREEATAGGTTRVATRIATDKLTIDKPAPMAGQVVDAVGEQIWSRVGPLVQAQPTTTVARIGGIATFAWYGDDPLNKTPEVRLQRSINGTFSDVVRVNGKPVRDREILLTYTPQPLQRMNNQPQRHVWVAEWQVMPWEGAIGVTEQSRIGGVPLGQYRFAIAGDGWTLNSSPFEVVPGGLTATAVRSGENWLVTATYEAPKGWRFIDEQLPSNQVVPLREGPLTATFLDSNDVVLSRTQQMTDRDGKASFFDTGPTAKIKIEDVAGNSQTITLPTLR